MTVEESKAVYARFVEEVVNRGNYDLIPDLFSASYLDHSLPPGAAPGLDSVRQVQSMFRAAFPDVHFTIEDMVGEGDKVATRVTGTGTHRGEFRGIPATGREASWSSMGFFRVADGKIVEHWGIPDLMGLTQQLSSG